MRTAFPTYGRTASCSACTSATAWTCASYLTSPPFSACTSPGYNAFYSCTPPPRHPTRLTPARLLLDTITRDKIALVAQLAVFPPANAAGVAKRLPPLQSAQSATCSGRAAVTAPLGVPHKGRHHRTHTLPTLTRPARRGARNLHLCPHENGRLRVDLGT